MLAAAFAQFVDPHPAAGNQFGHTVLPLSTGNVVVTAPFDDVGGTDAGAVYLFNGVNGQLISTLRGSSANDNIGLQGVKQVGGGNFVVISSLWNNASDANAGAVTFGKGTTGVNGAVSASNSLVGTDPDSSVGSGGVYVLTNGNYVVASPIWDDGQGANVGAFTFGNGNSGITGAVTAFNSLVGDTTGDGNANFADIDFVIPLTNGNYVVNMPAWNGNGNLAGAVAFGNGDSGVFGVAGPENSLVGSQMNDSVGGPGSRVVALPNGNYVVTSSWQRPATLERPGAINVGAVTFGNGTTGITGEITPENSLVGTELHDRIGNFGIVVLENSNYVVVSPQWDNGDTSDAGAITFGSGTTGVVGEISAANSLVGSTADDKLGARDFTSGNFVTPLKNGNYVVVSAQWDRGSVVNAGAVTFGDGTTGTKGVIGQNNSLVGSSQDDAVGINGVAALTNGNYVVSSSLWDHGATPNAGAATFGDGDTGVSGEITLANSLIGNANDRVALNGVTALTNGNYVVASSQWHNGNVAEAGAATWGDGTTGVQGLVSVENSFVGGASVKVGIGGVTPLTNGNYVVVGSNSATFGRGDTGLTGVLSLANSLYGGDFTAHFVGRGGVVALANGNYVVISPEYDRPDAPNVGAITLGNGNTGVSGLITAGNSLLGSKTDDQLGKEGVTALANGNYVVRSVRYDRGNFVDAGAVTFGNGTTGVVGAVDDANSARGVTANTGLQSIVVDSKRNTFFGRFLTEGGGVVRVGSQGNGFTVPPVISSFGGNLSYQEKAAGLRITTTALVSDVDSTNFAGGQLRISLSTGGTADDRLGIITVGTGAEQINVSGNTVRSGSLVIGAFSGGVGIVPLTIRLTANATPARVRSLLRNVAFSNVSDSPTEAPRTVRVTLSDGDGGTSPAVLKQISVVAVDDAPILEPVDGGTANYTNGSDSIALLNSATLTDPDKPESFEAGKLIVRAISGLHASNRILVRGGFTVAGNDILLDGVKIGTRNTGGGVGTTRLEITFTADATVAIVQRLVRGIRFSTFNGASTATRVIEFRVWDGDGLASNKATMTVNVAWAGPSEPSSKIPAMR